MEEVPKVPWLPAAATISTPRLSAWLSTSSSACSPLVEGCARARLRLITRAPALMHSRIAAASSKGVALGICSRPKVVWPKMRRIRRVQPGQMAGAGLPRFADRIPAIKVPCTQAVLSGCVQAAPLGPPTCWRCPAAKSGCLSHNGPIDEPDFDFRLPLVRSISAVSLTNSMGSKAFSFNFKANICRTRGSGEQIGQAAVLLSQSSKFYASTVMRTVRPSRPASVDCLSS